MKNGTRVQDFLNFLDSNYSKLVFSPQTPNFTVFGSKTFFMLSFMKLF